MKSKHIVAALLLLASGLLAVSACAPKPWPPVVGQAYPELTLTNYDGRKVSLSSFKGKVIIIEPVGLNCPACNAFNGAHRIGGFGGTVPQAGVDSFENMLSRSAHVSLADDRIVFVQLLLYDLSLNSVDREEAEAWAKHFRLDRRPNTYVLAGGSGLMNNASYNMIPGYQLIDKNFVLRADATGHHPRDSLTALIAKVPQLLNE